MKNRKDIEKETNGQIFTLDEFSNQIKNGTINLSEGIGYFHDGNKITQISVSDNQLKWDTTKKYPYICWYQERTNK